MSGPSASQENLESEQAAFYAQGIQQAETTFGEQQQLLSQIKGVYDPILAAGPSQEGFSAAEKSKLDAGVVDTTATNYKNAAKAVGESEAGLGGGDNPIPTGAQDELKEDVALSSGEEESREENQVDEADWQQGEHNFEDATAAEENVSGQYNPIGESTAATGAGNAASTTASAIASESDDWMNAAIGAAGEVGAGFACPAKGAVITMFDGSLRAVETLEIGEQILGASKEPETITSIRKVKSKVVRIITADRFVTRCSPTHALMLAATLSLDDVKYIDASQSKGEYIVTMRGSSAVIEVRPAGTADVYNIITDKNHTYLADGIWAVGDDA
jgi:hypothetical protein